MNILERGGKKTAFFLAVGRETLDWRTSIAMGSEV